MCQQCKKKAAEVQTMQYNPKTGQQVYVALCKECMSQLNKEAGEGLNNLKKFGIDLTELAKENKLDPIIGRSSEIERVIHVLSRRKKNNPVLLGEPGVGKTAIVEGLAQKIVQNKVPETLRGKRVISLEISSLLAGAVHRGTFEQRLKDIIKEVQEAKGQIILFIDEVHTVVGSGSRGNDSMDAANILKPYLSKGELQLVGATTLNEYRKYIEKDPALERRFQQVYVKEPTVKQSIRILKGLAPRYADHHHVNYSNSAIKASVELSKKYISERFLPDKAIDILDEAGAKVRLQAVKEPDNLKEVESEITLLQEKITENKDLDKENKKLNAKLAELNKVKSEILELWAKTKLEEIPDVTEDTVAEIISSQTGIPLTQLNIKEKEKLLELESSLEKKVIGQSKAVKVVASALRRSRSGLKAADKPIGAFLFLGPTGVGKTELTKQLAKTLYGDTSLIVRLDMSEYSEKHNISRMIGSPPGYVGYDDSGQLTEKVRRRPFSIVLLDEIEKAHPSIYNLLLQVMDEGRLTDGQGRTVDFKNTIIIMTSNVGTDFIKRNSIGFASDENNSVKKSHEKLEENLDDILKKKFAPEFINRLDEVVVFKELDKESITEIINLELAKLTKRLKKKKIGIKYSKALLESILEESYNNEFGARPIKRYIDKNIQNILSEELIKSNIKKDDNIILDIKDKKIYLKKK